MVKASVEKMVEWKCDNETIYVESGKIENR
jgi:hypothetical protein